MRRRRPSRSHALATPVVGAALLLFGLHVGMFERPRPVSPAVEFPALPAISAEEFPTPVRIQDTQRVAVIIPAMTTPTPRSPTRTTRHSIPAPRLRSGYPRYAGMSMEGLFREQVRLRGELDWCARREAEAKITAGQFEVVRRRPKMPSPPGSIDVYVPHREGLRKVSLSADEYPELHALREEIGWLTLHAGPRGHYPGPPGIGSP